MVHSDLEKNILESLPYSSPFLFVDSIIEVNENSITGTHSFLASESFYQGHFTRQPITPGVLLVETMGQIGLVCFGIFLLNLHETRTPFLPVLSNIECDFLEPVLPGETVTVVSEKIYFRNNVLKCKIEMTNSKNRVVARKTGICTFKTEL
jgi:3-hydroxyacyl-[acyl-carrier-protein] dehydratase